MTQPNPVPGGPVRPTPAEIGGPYSAITNGVCSDGHPMNSMGRCQPLNLQQFPAGTATPVKDTP